MICRPRNILCLPSATFLPHIVARPTGRLLVCEGDVPGDGWSTGPFACCIYRTSMQLCTRVRLHIPYRRLPLKVTCVRPGPAEKRGRKECENKACEWGHGRRVVSERESDEAWDINRAWDRACLGRRDGSSLPHTRTFYTGLYSARQGIIRQDAAPS
jgi:hypothetical protein